MKKSKLLQIGYVILSSILGGAACTSQQVSGSSDLRGMTQLETKTDKTDPPAQKTSDSENGPSLFHFASGSDYVVIATMTERGPVGKVNKKAELDLADLVAGRLFSFQVEKLLCSKEQFLPVSFSEQKVIHDFQIFVPGQISEENYLKDHKYLIFLQAQPETDKLAEVYELDKDKLYYRAFDGKTTYLFPAGHRTSTKGVIDLSDPEHQELAQRIEIFCKAFNETDKAARLNNLRKLADSPDEELKSNAAYAIKTFQ